VLHESRDDLRHQRLKALVVPVFLGIEDAVAVDHPTQVAGTVRPQR
jgi:hypothetical protein